MEYYRRYLCRMDPWPEAMDRSHEESSGEVYVEMWGPTEFHATGNLRDYDRTGRLHEISVPTLFTCGRYDEATPQTTASYQQLLPAPTCRIWRKPKPTWRVYAAFLLGKLIECLISNPAASGLPARSDSQPWAQAVRTACWSIPMCTCSTPSESLTIRAQPTNPRRRR